MRIVAIGRLNTTKEEMESPATEDMPSESLSVVEALAKDVSEVIDKAQGFFTSLNSESSGSWAKFMIECLWTAPISCISCRCRRFPLTSIATFLAVTSPTDIWHLHTMYVPSVKRLFGLCSQGISDYAHMGGLHRTLSWLAIGPCDTLTLLQHPFR